jgi:hypothetical protein
MSRAEPSCQNSWLFSGYMQLGCQASLTLITSRFTKVVLQVYNKIFIDTSYLHVPQTQHLEN